MESTELLLVYQDIGILKLDQAPFRVGDEVGRKIATVELHAFDHVQLELDARRFLNRDDAFLADLFHRFGDLATDDLVAIRSEEHTSELQSLMRISYAVFCLKKKNRNHTLLNPNPIDIQKQSPYHHKLN